jgi:hypothetical protein
MARKDFIISVGLLAASISTDAFASLDVNTQKALSPAVAVSQSFESNNSPFILKPASSSQNPNQFSYHSSHSSHASHASHASHSSHSSGGFGGY